MYEKKKNKKKNLPQASLLIPVGYEYDLFSDFGVCYYSENGILKDLPCSKCMFKENNVNCFFYYEEK